jgi:hypothetical protein
VAPAGEVRSDQPPPQEREPVSEKTPETAPVEEPTPQPTRERRSGAAEDVPELIRKLADLRDAGVVSDEEFEAKKADLLGRQRRPKLGRRPRRR